jgi:hypothetical protein
MHRRSCFATPTQPFPTVENAGAPPGIRLLPASNHLFTSHRRHSIYQQPPHALSTLNRICISPPIPRPQIIRRFSTVHSRPIQIFLETSCFSAILSSSDTIQCSYRKAILPSRDGSIHPVRVLWVRMKNGFSINARPPQALGGNAVIYPDSFKPTRDPEVG